MKNYTTNKIRNVSFLGHRGSGKTSLVEALLFTANVISKMGSIERGNTISDYEEEEITRGLSINTSVISLDYQEKIFNILDTPGYFDFSGEVVSALSVTGGAVIVVDASAGIEIGTEKSWRELEERKIPRLIFINKMDKGAINYKKILLEMKEKFGKKIAPFCIPLGEGEDFKGFINVVEKKCRIFDGENCNDKDLVKHESFEDIRNLLLEAVAETSEEAMEKFFEGKEFSEEEIKKGLRKGVLNGDVVPVLVGSAINGIGVATLFNMMFNYMPTPQEAHEGIVYGTNPENAEEIIKRKVDINEPFSAFVFKTIVDPFIGKISLFRVMSGSLSKDVEILNSTQGKKEKISNLYFIRGIKQRDTEKVVAGDIAATTKIQDLKTGDTLCDKNNPILFEKVQFPKPCLFMKITPAKNSDDEKLSLSLQKLTEEDPTIKVIRNSETKELLVGGQGKRHLEIIVSKLLHKFQVQSTLHSPKIAYRETIQKIVSAQGRHKKQSGGAGQFGEVFIKFEPYYDNEYAFVDETKGGVVPKQYMPAIEKGLHEASKKGSLAGYPVINYKATIYDGSHHPVDSNEISFKMAAILAFRKAMEEGGAVLLEPIIKMQITVPEEYTGDIMGNINKRRGKILGMEPMNYNEQKIIVEVPQREVLGYAVDLKSMTQGRGKFEFEFLKYDYAPEEISQKIIAESEEKE